MRHIFQIVQTTKLLVSKLQTEHIIAYMIIQHIIEKSLKHILASNSLCIIQFIVNIHYTYINIFRTVVIRYISRVRSRKFHCGELVRNSFKRLRKALKFMTIK